MKSAFITVAILMVLLAFIFIGWKFFGKGEIISATGTIKYIPLEGGFYGIETEKGEKYLPLNLPAEFKKDGLKVWFKAKPRRGATIQMWGKPVEILEIKVIEETKNLSQIKVAILYERIGDGKQINRTIDDEIKIFKETTADFIFRAFWRWSPCPEKCEDLPEKQKEKYVVKGYSYEYLEKTISKIKSELPEIIVCGAVPAQIIHKRVVWNPKTKEIIRYPETWDLALDPSKWGINMSKEEFQCRFAKTHFWVPQDLDCKDYTSEIASAYFPDITNEKFQRLLLSWAERQIDAGVDAIWIDMLFAQAKFLYRISGDFNHKSLKETWDAVCKIVDELHAYGRKRGRHIYVGSWATASWFPYEAPKLDFVTVSPSAREVRTLTLDSKKWDERLKSIRKKHPKCPIFAFIDWAGSTKTPLGQFSQFLSKEQQRRFIRLADEFFAKRGVVFVYPVHGGWMGNDAAKLAFGKFRSYDSLAPEFKTYQTIGQSTLFFHLLDCIIKI